MSSFNVSHPDYYNLYNYINKGKDKVSRRIGNNTSVILCDDKIVVKYHSSYIATLTQAQVTINPCGWYTSTTKDRINWILSTLEYKISQVNNQWYLYQFYNNVPIGKVSGEIVYNLQDSNWIGLTPIQDKTKDTELKAIKAYCKAYIEKLFNGEISKPDSGDCFYCYMSFPDNRDHIESHISESYYVPSLLVKAIKFKLISQVAGFTLQSLWYDKTQDTSMFYDIAKRQLESSLLSYVKHCMSLDN